MLQILDMNEKLCNEDVDIQQGFLQYYTHLLGSSHSVSRINSWIVETGKCVTAIHVEQLLAPVSAEEVTRAMFDIDGKKAPGR